MSDLSRLVADPTIERYRAFLGTFADVVDSLARDDRTDLLLMQLRESGHGWAGRAALLERQIRKARKAHAKSRLRVVTASDAEPGPELLRTMIGAVRANLANAEAILGASEYRIRRNEFTGRVEVDGEVLADETVLALTVDLQRRYDADFGEKQVAQAARIVAGNDAYHPIRDYLEGLTWDGTERIGGLLRGYFGAVAVDDDHVPVLAEMSIRWMVGAVARVIIPGCKLDTVLCLQGPQGALKSTAFRELAPDWYSDSELTVGSKDLYLGIQGTWLYEVAEIDKWTMYSRANLVKSVISGRSDKYRPPYGSSTIQVDRQCVFVGTVNPESFLTDPTGSRRYWPVTVTRTRPDDIARDRDQLWAEAYEAFRRGVAWWFDSDGEALIAAYSAQYQEYDAWTSDIASFLDTRSETTIGDLFADLKIEATNQDTKKARRMSGILRRLGWERGGRRYRDGRHLRIWTRKPAPDTKSEPE